VLFISFLACYPLPYTWYPLIVVAQNSNRLSTTDSACQQRLFSIRSTQLSEMASTRKTTKDQTTASKAKAPAAKAKAKATKALKSVKTTATKAAPAKGPAPEKTPVKKQETPVKAATGKTPAKAPAE
jgi:hypothetical protein